MCSAESVEHALAECLYANRSTAGAAKACVCDYLCPSILDNAADTACSPGANTGGSCNAGYLLQATNSTEFLTSPQGSYCNQSFSQLRKNHCYFNSSPDPCPLLNPTPTGVDPVAIALIAIMSLIIIIVALYCFRESYRAEKIKKASKAARSSQRGRSASDGKRSRCSDRKLITISEGSAKHLIGAPPKQKSYKKKKNKNKQQVPMRKLSSWFRSFGYKPDSENEEPGSGTIPQPEILNGSTRHTRNLSSSSNSRSELGVGSGFDNANISPLSSALATNKNMPLNEEDEHSPELGRSADSQEEISVQGAAGNRSLSPIRVNDES